MSKTIELPSILSFERKLETSDALMYAGNWQDIENAGSHYFLRKLLWASLPNKRQKSRDR